MPRTCLLGCQSFRCCRSRPICIFMWKYTSTTPRMAQRTTSHRRTGSCPDAEEAPVPRRLPALLLMPSVWPAQNEGADHCSNPHNGTAAASSRVASDPESTSPIGASLSSPPSPNPFNCHFRVPRYCYWFLYFSCLLRKSKVKLSSLFRPIRFEARCEKYPWTSTDS